MKWTAKIGLILPAAALLWACGSEAPATPDQVAAWKSAGEQLIAAADCARPGPTCPGAKAPDLSGVDFNPTSASHQQEVTVAPAAEAPKVVALLAGW